MHSHCPAPPREQPCSAARTVLCRSISGTVHPLVPHCNRGFVRAAPLQGGHPARLGVGSSPGLNLHLLTISKQGRCLQESAWSFPSPSTSQQGAEPLLAHNPVLQIGQQIEPWLTAQLTPAVSQPVGMLHASGVFLRHLLKSALV